MARVAFFALLLLVVATATVATATHGRVIPQRKFSCWPTLAGCAVELLLIVIACSGH